MSTPWELDYSTPGRLVKGRAMRPRPHAGSKVGTAGLANRSGGKSRGVKGGSQKKAKPVNVTKLKGGGAA